MFGVYLIFLNLITKKRDDINSKKENSKFEKTKILKQRTDKQTQINLQPSIDSYIINTIKLNWILTSGRSFDQISYFSNKPKEVKSECTKQRKNAIQIHTDNDARHHLKQFISVMSIHCGFTGEFNNFLKSLNFFCR